MIKSKGIFAVSFIAMMVVGGAYANIASQGYVDQQVDAKQNASTAVKVATAGTAVGDTSHPVYVNASGVATRIDKVAAAESADTATSATKATQDGNGANIANTYAKKTELPTVNNATLTIQKNGATVDTFTANASANKRRRDCEPRDQGRYCDKCNNRSVRHQGDPGRVWECDYNHICHKNRDWF